MWSLDTLWFGTAEPRDQYLKLLQTRQPKRAS